MNKKYQSPIDYEIYEGETASDVVAELRAGCLASFFDNAEYRRNVAWRFDGVLDIDASTDDAFLASFVKEGILVEVDSRGYSFENIHPIKPSNK